MKQPAGAAWLNIGAVAAQSGVSAKMVRHYESLGLLGPVARSEGGYRQYTAVDVHNLQFIKRARDLGFPIKEIGELVGLWHDRKRASARVKRIAERHISQLAQRVEALQSMRRTLEQLVACCAGDARPDCPILDDLAGAGNP